ncbi:MAG: TatD family hydrolase [Candidatus Micrarchaeota archaeon]|nr:TatD family hydrolase [Candidatus Micrarchaeota archaeon]
MPQYYYADAHCHLDSCAGVLLPHILMITCGTSHETNLRSMRIAGENHNVYFTAGISPQEAMRHPDIKIKLVEWEEAISSLLADSGRLVGIGEIGLDYHWAKTEEQKHLQYECFISQLQLAERLSLPAVIHSRDAEEECLEILRNFNIRFMMHCFSGTESQAKEAASSGGTVSIPPVSGSERKKFIASLPLEKLVAESDAPAIGKTPEAAAESIKMIAQIKGLDEEAVRKATLMNTILFFGIR